MQTKRNVVFISLFPILAIWTACRGPGKPPTTIEWITVQGGKFQMGDTFGDGTANELPVHSVTLSSFQISKYEVTNKQYAAFLNEYGSDKVKSGDYADEKMIYESGLLDFHDWGLNKTGNTWQPANGCENHPVMYVTWFGAYEFCKHYGYRLPTEAEWEYAAKGGGKNQGYEYSGSNTLGDVAWFFDNSGSRTRTAGSKNANELGIFDMSGNLYEWCQDWYAENYYAGSPSRNPKGPGSGVCRVLRGGSWHDLPWRCRASGRGGYEPDYRYHYFGFRCAR